MGERLKALEEAQEIARTAIKQINETLQIMEYDMAELKREEQKKIDLELQEMSREGFQIKQEVA